MSDEMQQKIEGFITDLMGAPGPEIHGYLSDICSNAEFRQDIADHWDDGSGVKPFSVRVLGMDLAACLALYTLCRVLKPAVVVETGVAGGISSSYILLALEENRKGTLYSIDVPWYTVTENWKLRYAEEELVPRAIEKRSGWLIPDYLRGRWQLAMGKSTDSLIPLLDSLGTIDLFFHDSQHTYETMMWEFQNAWPTIKKGGVLIAHNTNLNGAFTDFGSSVSTRTVLLNSVNDELGRNMTTGAMQKA